ncbi:MAG: 16S rRNA (adenine(1518)-N(6)/adenine(1519)-N(6))-dimethyltransferase RsmA [bacterium]
MLQKLSAFQARKSLGQNFLHDENIARKIVRAIYPLPGESIIEIGPGFGVLTKYLVESGCRYVGVEIDDRLVPELEEKFDSFKNFELRHADFRKLDLTNLTSNPASLRLVGNIPYHITSSIVFKAFKQHELIRDMVLMVQKEVAERIVSAAGNKSYGILSVISQTFSHPQILFTVSPHVFTPKPEVESAILRMDFSRKKQPPPEEPDFFRKMIKQAFGQRRKTLRNSLKSLGNLDHYIQSNNEIFNKRPEELQVDELIGLANMLNKVLKMTGTADFSNTLSG